jgi:hypothetical protein
VCPASPTADVPATTMVQATTCPTGSLRHHCDGALPWAAYKSRARILGGRQGMSVVISVIVPSPNRLWPLATAADPYRAATSLREFVAGAGYRALLDHGSTPERVVPWRL